MLLSKSLPPPNSTKDVVAVLCLAATLILSPVLHAEKPPWPAAAGEKVSLALTAASLVDVVSALAKVSDVPIQVDARLLPRRVDLTAEELPLHQVLERLAAAAEAELRWRDGAAVLTPKPGSTTPPLPPRRRAPQMAPLRPGPESGIAEPKKIRTVPPEYPREARMARVEGLVILDVTIDEGGRPAKVEVLREASHGLTEAAVNAVRLWLWEPVIHQGRAVPVTFPVTIRFSLGEGGPPPRDPAPGWVSPP